MRQRRTAADFVLLVPTNTIAGLGADGAAPSTRGDGGAASSTRSADGVAP